MAIFTRSQLEPLLRAGPDPRVSIFLPTQRLPSEAAQNPIRFRNALREAERLLGDRHSAREVRSLLDPVAELSTPDFWQHQGDGLAVFRSPDRLEHFRVPLALPELVVVAESFHVRPLLRSLQANLRYFLLALSQNSAAVYEGTSVSLAVADVPDLPRGVSEIPAGGRGGVTLSAHSTGTGRGGRRIHAAGGSESSSQERLLRYFRGVDRAVARALGREQAPVILAGVGYYVPLYREVSRLRNLSDRAVEGSPDAMTPEDLRTRAWPIAEAVLRHEEERALEEYHGALAKGRALGDLEPIVRAAFRGRVRRLFLAQGIRIWGTLDRQTGRVQRAAAQQGSRDDDLLDDIAEAVLTRRGEVLTLPPERMPEGREVVAHLRY